MNSSTLEKIRKLNRTAERFFGMFHAFKSSLETGQNSNYTPDELLTHLVDAEWDD
jgi:hypothetical protein